MKNPVIYVILNGKLNMSPGKAAAQTAHAVMMLGQDARNEFMSDFKRTVIVLSASGREQMDGIVDYLVNARMDYEYYIDEGVNEVEAFSMTAIAVSPISSEDVETREIFGALPLYPASTNHKELAWFHLEKVGRDLEGYDGMEIIDDRPRFLKKTLKWLAK